MFKPEVISFDYETTNLNYWEGDFRVLSCAFSYRDRDGVLQSDMTMGETETWEYLMRIAAHKVPLVCHNLQFEYGVTKHRFSNFNLDLIKYDTMRIVQVYDNGGPGDRMQLSLVKCAERLFPDYEDHKKEAHDWLKEAGYKKPGENLDKLPADIFKRYNVADTEITLRIWETAIEYFKTINYDWTMDHSLYRNITVCIADSRARGVKVDRDRLEDYRGEVGCDIRRIQHEFRDVHLRDIEGIEKRKKEEYIQGVKTEKGQESRRKKLETQETYEKVIKFNAGSGDQLRELFIDVQGHKPVFFTPSGKASTAAAHLNQFGDGGMMLVNKKKRELVVTQSKNLLALSEDDGRWHIDLKSTGCKTGRFSGGRHEEG